MGVWKSCHVCVCMHIVSYTGSGKTGKSHTHISSNPSNVWKEPVGVLLERVEAWHPAPQDSWGVRSIVWHPKTAGVLGPLYGIPRQLGC